MKAEINCEIPHKKPPRKKTITKNQNKPKDNRNCSPLYIKNIINQIAKK
jgi:hypothetical protein